MAQTGWRPSTQGNSCPCAGRSTKGQGWPADLCDHGSAWSQNISTASHLAGPRCPRNGLVGTGNCRPGFLAAAAVRVPIRHHDTHFHQHPFFAILAEEHIISATKAPAALLACVNQEVTIRIKAEI